MGVQKPICVAKEEKLLVKLEIFTVVVMCVIAMNTAQQKQDQTAAAIIKIIARTLNVSLIKIYRSRKVNLHLHTFEIQN